MFGFLKKKPLEVKYGHENYLEDYASFEANDRNWILMLSALFVEAKDLEMEGHRARHDVLAIYPRGSLTKDDRDELSEDFVLKTVDQIHERMDEVSELVSRYFEDKLYYVINCNSLAEVRTKAKEKLENNRTEEKFFETIWENRERYKHTHLRIGFIAHSIWQIRIAAFFGVVDEKSAWGYMEELADYARPLMTLFDSWEAYLENLQHFHEIYEFEYPEERKYIQRAMTCLNVREESPLKLIAFDFGVDKSYEYNIKSHSNRLPKRTPSGQYPLRLRIIGLLEQEDKTELFEELDKLTGEEYEQEFAQISSCSSSGYFSQEELLELPERYNNVYAYAIRSNFFSELAWDVRGSGTADTVSDENVELFYERLAWAVDDLLEAYKLKPMDKTVWGKLYDLLSHFDGEEATQKREEIFKLIQEHGLSHRGCIYSVSRHKQTRWGGSFQENLDWAREVIAGTQKGDIARLIIYDVMIEHFDYVLAFEEDEVKAHQIFKNKQYQDEVNQYLDELLTNLDEYPYNLADTLCYWYSNVGDYHRLRKVVHSMEIGRFDLSAMNNDYDAEYTEIIMNWFRSV